MRKILIIFFLFFLNSISFASNSYFLMLKNKKVNVRYGPSFDYPIKFIYKKKFLPVEIIDKKENFRKILDHKKNTGWIHISQLSKKKAAIIIDNNQFIFQRPSIYSKPSAVLKKGRLCKIKKCRNNWCKVQVDKFNGWVKQESMWGLF